MANHEFFGNYEVKSLGQPDQDADVSIIEVRPPIDSGSVRSLSRPYKMKKEFATLYDSVKQYQALGLGWGSERVVFSNQEATWLGFTAIQLEYLEESELESDSSAIDIIADNLQKILDDKTVANDELAS